MQIDFGSHPQQVPPYAFADTHRHRVRPIDCREVVPQEAVDRVLEVALLEFLAIGELEIHTGGRNVVLEVPARVLVVDHEQVDELAIDVLGRAVGVPPPFSGDDHRTDEARVGVFGFVHVGVVHPEYTAAVVRPGTSAFGDRPDVRVRPARRYGVPDRHAVFIVVRRSFGCFRVEHAVRMDAERPIRVIAEDDADRIVHLRANQRA